MVYLFSCFSAALVLRRSSYLSFALLRIATLSLLTKHKLVEFRAAGRGAIISSRRQLSECVGGDGGGAPHCCDTLDLVGAVECSVIIHSL